MLLFSLFQQQQLPAAFPLTTLATLTTLIQISVYTFTKKTVTATTLPSSNLALIVDCWPCLFIFLLLLILVFALSSCYPDQKVALISVFTFVFCNCHSYIIWLLYFHHLIFILLFATTATSFVLIYFAPIITNLIRQVAPSDQEELLKY